MSPVELRWMDSERLAACSATVVDLLHDGLAARCAAFILRLGSLTMDPKERAKLVIAETIRQAGGVLQNKTNLFKAFYHAHLIYSQKHAGYLSTWPIVKMPNGPGIHHSDELLGELMAQGVLQIGEVRAGNYTAFKFELCDDRFLEGQLEPEAVEAIAEAVKIVEGKSAYRVSSESHAHSRTWRNAADGEELAIYCDLIPDAEYRERRDRMEATAEILRDAWNQPSDCVGRSTK